VDITLSYENIRKAAKTSPEAKAALMVLAPKAFGIVVKGQYTDEGRAFAKAADDIGLFGVEPRQGGAYDSAGLYLPSHINGQRVKWFVANEGGTSVLVPEVVK